MIGRLVAVARLAACALVVGIPGQLRAQASLELSTGRAVQTAELDRSQGFAAFRATALTDLGWRVGRADDVWRVDHPLSSVEVTVRAGSPIVAWADGLVQLTYEPYEREGELFLPLQFATDVVPDRMATRFRAVGSTRLEAVQPDPGPVDPADLRFVVVIDPGHGGEDPGAMGVGGAREKDVALAFARVLADSLRARGDRFEVHLTRERDVLVPLWQRGEIATRLKGDRPGVFLSIHANALARREVRGVETYWLSEARTEHERRVAALENAPLALERPQLVHDDPGLGFILNELRNLDHQHWSSDLAGVVQRALAGVHPGPDRGVKQAPLAMLTTALMPSALLELGFITHRDEERLIASPEFHRRAAGALAAALETFAGRYPPGRAQLRGSAR